MDGQELAVSGRESPILLRRGPLVAVHSSGILRLRSWRLFHVAEGSVAGRPVRSGMAVLYGGEQQDIALSEPNARPLAYENRKLRLPLAQLKGQDRALAGSKNVPRFASDTEDDSSDVALGNLEEEKGACSGWTCPPWRKLRRADQSRKGFSEGPQALQGSPVRGQSQGPTISLQICLRRVWC